MIEYNKEKKNKELKPPETLASEEQSRNADRLIDQIVHKFCGLTEEEINIVEES